MPHCKEIGLTPTEPNERHITWGSWLVGGRESRAGFSHSIVSSFLKHGKSFGDGEQGENSTREKGAQEEVGILWKLQHFILLFPTHFSIPIVTVSIVEIVFSSWPPASGPPPASCFMAHFDHLSVFYSPVIAGCHGVGGSSVSENKLRMCGLWRNGPCGGVVEQKSINVTQWGRREPANPQRTGECRCGGKFKPRNII